MNTELRSVKLFSELVDEMPLPEWRLVFNSIRIMLQFFSVACRRFLFSVLVHWRLLSPQEKFSRGGAFSVTVGCGSIFPLSLVYFLGTDFLRGTSSLGRTTKTRQDKALVTLRRHHHHHHLYLTNFLYDLSPGGTLLLSPIQFFLVTLSTQSVNLNFNTFKQSFSTNVNAIKRRFSSSDLANDGSLQDEEGATSAMTTEGHVSTPNQRPSQQQSSSSSSQPHPSQPASTISAPTSPIKSGSSILQRVQSLTGAVTKEVTTTVSNVIDKYSSNTNIKIERNPRDIIILVVDDYKTEWSKYFPATLQNLNLKCIQLQINQFYTLAVETTTLVFPLLPTGGTGSPFIPDFVFFRQPLNNYKSILISFNYTNVESINNLQSLYNGLDKPWIWGQMNALKLPLIEQVFYSDYRAMGYYYFKSSNILKLGSYHGGLGKLKVKDVNEWQDSIGIVQLSKDYCTAEPYVETRTEVHLQKIGPQYKGFMKKSLGPSWKSSTANTILEEIQITDRYKGYLDAVGTHLNLDILQLEFLIHQGKEYLMELNDSSSLNFLGEGQEEDKKLIVDMILSRLTKVSGTEEWARKRSAISGTSGGGGRRGSISSDDKPTSRRESQGSVKYLKQNSVTDPTNVPGDSDDTMDTMKNLRKTFQGIFGDM